MASPISESGTGTAYEFLVVTYLWGLLAAEEEFPPNSTTVVGVECQRSDKGIGFDDLVVSTKSDHNSQMCLIQAKRTLKVQSSNPVFQDVINRAHKDAANRKFANACLVVVVENISPDHKEVLESLGEYARSSLTPESFEEKIQSEKASIQAGYQSILDVLTVGGIVPALDAIFRTVRAIYIWHLQLEHRSSNSWVVWRSLLKSRMLKPGTAEVDRLKDRFYADAAKAGRWRKVHDFRSLRAEYPFFTRPVLPDPAATSFAQETLKRYRAQVEAWKLERHYRLYETLSEIRSFLAEAEVLLATHGWVGAAATTYAEIAADVKAVEGGILLNLEFNGSYESWITSCQPFADISDLLRETMARFALVAGDRPSFDEWFNKVLDPDAKKLLTCFLLSEEKRWPETASLATQVSGVRRPSALGLARFAKSQAAEVEPDAKKAFDLAKEALEFVKEAKLLAPERPMIGLQACEAAFLVVKPGISGAYDGAVGVTPPDIGESLDEASRLLSDVAFATDTFGIHERTLAAICSTDAMEAAGRLPAVPSSVFDLDMPYIQQIPLQKQLHFAQLCGSYGRKDLCDAILGYLQDEARDPTIRDSATEFANALSATDPLNSQPKSANQASPHAWGEVCLRLALESVRTGQVVTQDTIKRVTEKAPGTAWLHAVESLAALQMEQPANELDHIQKLISGFPEAVFTYGMLTNGLIQVYAAVNQVSNAETESDSESASDADDRQTLSSRGERVRALILSVVRQAGGELGLRGALDGWFFVAANPTDPVELDQVAAQCKRNKHTQAFWSATFLAEFGRRRARNSLKIYADGVQDGWLPPTALRSRYDQVRAQIGLWDDLASEATSWLQTPDRWPSSIAPSVHALVVLGRGKEAFQIALDNASDFHESPEAAHIVVTTARSSGREDWVRYHLEFSERFPDDYRAGKSVSTEEAVPMLFQPHPRKDQYELHEVGLFPIHFLGESLALNYENAVKGNGLITWRSGIPIQSQSQFDRPILLDATAVMTAEHLGLWTAMSASGITFVVHPSVVDTLVFDDASLRLEALEEDVTAANRAEKLLERVPTRDLVAITDEEEALRIGGEICSSWGDSGFSLLSLIRLSSKVGRAEKQRLERVLAPQFASSSSPEATAPARRIVLSATDVHSICLANEVEAVLACFEAVSVSIQGRYWINRFLSRAYLQGKAAQRSSRTINALKVEIDATRITLAPSNTEPTLTSLGYLQETARIAREHKYTVWADDAGFRALVTHEVPDVPTCCLWDMLSELLRRETIARPEFDVICVEAIQSGLIPALRFDALALVLGQPNPDSDVRRYIYLLCNSMKTHRTEHWTGKVTELRIGAEQLAYYLTTSESRKDLVVGHFLEFLPKPYAHLFWNTVFVLLAQAERDLWALVLSLSLRVETAGQYVYSEGLMDLIGNPQMNFPSSSYARSSQAQLVKFEYRWRWLRIKRKVTFGKRLDTPNG